MRVSSTCSRLLAAARATTATGRESQQLDNYKYHNYCCNSTLRYWSFVDVRALLRSISALTKTSKGYYGQVGYANTLIYMYMYIYISYLSLSIYIYIYMYLYLYLYLYLSIYLSIYIYIYIYKKTSKGYYGQVDGINTDKNKDHHHDATERLRSNKDEQGLLWSGIAVDNRGRGQASWGATLALPLPPFA